MDGSKFDGSFSCGIELEVSLLATTCVFKIQAVAKAAQLSDYFPLCPPPP